MEVTTRGETVIYIGINGQIAGTVSMVDDVREEAAATVNALHRMGVKTSMLSGDKQWAADSVAAKVGISLDQVFVSNIFLSSWFPNQTTTLEMIVEKQKPQNFR